MRRLIASAAALILMAASAFSQTRPMNEINISYGSTSVPSYVTKVGTFDRIFSSELSDIHDVEASGALGIEFVHYPNRHIGIGFAGIDEYATFNISTYDGKDDNGSMVYTDKEPGWTNFLSFMPVIKLPWFYTEHVSMYTKCAAGGGIQVSSHDEVGDYFFLAYQISPVGINFGGSRFRGFAELGLGMQGMFNVGFHYAF